MHECHHNTIDPFIFSFLGEYGMIVTLLVSGLLGGFTHCIGMCGPIAVAISTNRLLGMHNSEMSEFKKIKLLLTMPYYFGKATTYGFLALIFFSLKTAFANFFMAKILAFSLLILVSISFVVMALSMGSFLKISLPKPLKKIESFITKSVDRFANGNQLLLFIQGMILGLIPCGLVISSVVTAASYSSNSIAAFMTMFLFGVSTIPALFCATYFGSFFLSFKKTKIFKLFFSLAMLLNAYYVLGYALKLF